MDSEAALRLWSFSTDRIVLRLVWGAPQRLHARLRPQFKKLELDDDIVQSMTLREKISPRKIFIGVSP